MAVWTEQESEKGDVAVREADLLCHELLLRLAGRVPDRHLWRYRDWLAGDASDVIARLLPSTLVRERIALSDADHQLLTDTLLPLGATAASVHAVLPGVDSGADTYAFAAEAPLDDGSDPVVLVLGATLRGRHGVREVRSSWRYQDNGRLKRVLLVSASTDVIELTGEIQRILRALGDETPSVEVLPPDVEPTEYHRAALAESTLVCAGADQLTARG